MTKNKQKNGAGKFFLGAILGAAAGAVASKFFKTQTDSTEVIEEKPTPTPKPAPKKPAPKTTSEKK